MVTFQKLNDMCAQLMYLDSSLEVEKLKNEKQRKQDSVTHIRKVYGQISEVEEIEAKIAVLNEQIKYIQEYNDKYDSKWELKKIMRSVVSFSVDLIMPVLAELFSNLEDKEYKYYEVLSTEREKCDGERDILYRRLHRLFSTIPYAVYYPEDHMAKRTSVDESLVRFFEGDYCITLGIEEFGKHIYFDRAKFPTVALYRFFDGGSTFIAPFIGKDNDYTHEDDNKRIVEYSKLFINKVIDYRLEKVYPNFEIDKRPIYDSFVSSSVREDITYEELSSILTDFIADYKAGVKVKQKVFSEE